MGGWVIDRTNWSKVTAVSRYGPWAAGIGLGMTAVMIAAYGPAEFLIKLRGAPIA